MDVFTFMLGLTLGLTAGVVAGTALIPGLRWLVARRRSNGRGLTARARNILRAEFSRPDFDGSIPLTIEPSRHQLEAEEWLEEFEAINPIIDMSTPQGLAAAYRALEQEKLPRYIRRQKGLL